MPPKFQKSFYSDPKYLDSCMRWNDETEST